MARYSLRNKHRIEKAYSREFLNSLVSSLDEHFKSEVAVEYRGGDRYGTITVGRKYELYVISKTYDVYNLAFKQEISQ